MQRVGRRTPSIGVGLLRYSNPDTLLLVRSMKAVIGDEQSFLTFPRRALLNKIGMRSTFPEIDPYGNFILSSQMWTTPRDLARFGLLFLHDGVWNGERILPRGWVDYSVQKAPARQASLPVGVEIIGLSTIASTRRRGPLDGLGRPSR